MQKLIDQKQLLSLASPISAANRQTLSLSNVTLGFGNLLDSKGLLEQIDQKRSRTPNSEGDKTVSPSRMMEEMKQIEDIFNKFLLYRAKHSNELMKRSGLDGVRRGRSISSHRAQSLTPIPLEKENLLDIKGVLASTQDLVLYMKVKQQEKQERQRKTESLVKKSQQFKVQKATSTLRTFNNLQIAMKLGKESLEEEYQMSRSRTPILSKKRSTGRPLTTYRDELL